MKHGKIIAAARAARKFIAASRRVIVRSHAAPPRYRVETVTNPGAADWIAEHDAVLAKLDAAIADATGSAT